MARVNLRCMLLFRTPALALVLWMVGSSFLCHRSSKKNSLKLFLKERDRDSEIRESEIWIGVWCWFCILLLICLQCASLQTRPLTLLLFFFSFATKSKYYSKCTSTWVKPIGVCVCARFYYYPYVGGARYVPSSGVQRGSGTGSDTGGAQDPFTGTARHLCSDSSCNFVCCKAYHTMIPTLKGSQLHVLCITLPDLYCLKKVHRTNRTKACWVV